MSEVEAPAPGAATKEKVLEVRNASKTFGMTRALDSFDFDLNAGEVHAVVGQNGSGKSTFVKLLSGFHSLDGNAETEVKVAGTPLHLHDVEASREAGLRFVHQDLGLVPDLSTIENLALGRGYQSRRGRPINWRRERAATEKRLAALGYDFDVTAPVRNLAIAERTGIAVARAIADSDQARVLVVDEPTATLPGGEVRSLFQALERVRAQGLGIVYISHRLDEVFEIADRVTVLRNGRRVGVYATKDLDPERLISLMVGDIDLSARPPGRPQTGATLMKVKDLCGVQSLGLDFELRAGEILGIAGLTGSGREEVLSMLFGALPRNGTVTVEGVEVPPERPDKAIDAGLAFVPVDRLGKASVVTMNVRENCTLTDLGRHAGTGRRVSRKAERAEVEEWIHKLDVRPDSPEAPFVALSGGNQQKVVVAKWLRMKPKVMLLDDATQGVDIGAKKAIHDLAREVASSGESAVLVASTDELELCDICDRVLVMRDGEFVAELAREGLSPEQIIAMQI
jgi:ribose transport system ATP-binding protein